MLNPGRRTSALPIAAAIFVGTACLYLLTMPVVSQYSGDAIAEVSLAQRSGPARSNHLLLSPLYRDALNASAALGFGGKPFLIPQLINVLSGALCVSCFFLLSSRLGGTRAESASVALFMALSYAPWYHSREAESAIVSLAFLLVSLTLIAARADVRTEERLWSLALAGATLAMAMLFALNAALLLPGIVLFLWILSEPVVRWRRVGSFLAGFTPCAAIPLILASRSVVAPWSLGGWLRWLSHHESENGLPEVGNFTLTNLLRAVSGALNYFVGDTSVTTIVKELLHGRFGLAISPSEWARFALGALLLGALLWRAAYRPRDGTSSAAVVLMAIGGGVHGLFNCLWLGSDPQFWLPIVPTLMLAATLRGRLEHDSARRSALRIGPWIVACCALFVTNVRYPVPTTLVPFGGSEWRTARAFAQQVNPEDLMVYSEGWARLLPAFGGSQSVSLVYQMNGVGTEYLDLLDRRIDQTLAGGRRVYALNVFEIVSPEALGMWQTVEKSRGVTRTDVVSRLRARYRVTALGSPGLSEIERQRPA